MIEGITVTRNPWQSFQFGKVRGFYAQNLDPIHLNRIEESRSKLFDFSVPRLDREFPKRGNAHH